MKKKFLALTFSLIFVLSLFSGCGKSDKETTNTATPDDVEPSYYTSEEELPDDAYYIVKKVTVKEKKKKVKETRYYPLLSAENTCTNVQDNYTGFDATRVEWVNYSVDEGLIPTMSEDDELIYKSANMIPTKYSLEKFFDNGYTFGVCGLKEDLSGNCKYDPENGAAVLSTSSAAGFSGLSEVESVYLVSCKENTKKGDAKEVKITSDYLSDSGTVENLDQMKSYDCDIRTGTEKVAATLVCDTHYFSSAETYRFGSFDFVTEHIARLNVPDYASTGYYTIGSSENAGGFFRYVKGNADYHDLKASDYNKTIYLYDENGSVGGTTTGLVFDPETGFLVGTEDLSDSYDSSTANTALYTYDQYKGLKTGKYTDETSDPEDSITNKTTLETIDGDTYMGTFTISSITKSTITENKRLYEFTATEETTADTLNFRYFGKTGEDAVVPTEGGKYTIQFAPATGLDGYLISYMEQISEGTATDETASAETTDATEATQE